MRHERSKRDLEDYLIANLGCLEHCAGTVGDEYLLLNAQYGGNSPRARLTMAHVETLAPAIMESTRAFLGVHDIPAPKIRVYSAGHAIKAGLVGAAWVFGVEFAVAFAGVPLGPPIKIAVDMAIISLISYMSMNETNETPYYSRGGLVAMLVGKPKLVNLGKTTMTSIVGDLAHEYTHYIQDCKTDLLLGYRGLCEGHARGVERHLCDLAAQHSGCLEIKQDTLLRTARELKHGYLDICDITGKRPSAAIAGSGVPRAGCSHLLPMLSAHHYCLGTSVMQVAEEKHGVGVYQKVIEDDLSFLRA